MDVWRRQPDGTWRWIADMETTTRRCLKTSYGTEAVSRKTDAVETLPVYRRCVSPL